MEIPKPFKISIICNDIKLLSYLLTSFFIDTQLNFSIGSLSKFPSYLKPFKEIERMNPIYEPYIDNGLSYT